MNVRVEYESTPIRHIAVQCPKCNKWFNGRDIFNGDWLQDLRYSYQIFFAQFECPMCGKIFGGDECRDFSNVNIEETSYPEVYKDCLHKKEVWE